MLMVVARSRILPHLWRGDRLRALREQAGLSTAALGAKIGVSNATISLWENDQRKPKGESVEDMASIFGVDSKHFYDWVDPSSIPKKKGKSAPPSDSDAPA